MVPVSKTVRLEIASVFIAHTLHTSSEIGFLSDPVVITAKAECWMIWSFGKLAVIASGDGVGRVIIGFDTNVVREGVGFSVGLPNIPLRTA